MDIKIQYLTKEQKKKADRIVKLLSELRKTGVYPYVIDGGGGDGLCFVRCPKEDLCEFEEIIVGLDFELRRDVEEYIYQPHGSCHQTVSTLVP